MKSLLRHLLLSLSLFAAAPAQAELPLVATLHPILTEMVQRLAGDHVRVEELMGPNVNPHGFDPTPRDLARIQSASLVVAMGKNLEVYLDRLAASLPPGTPIFEAGARVTSLQIHEDHISVACCSAHTTGAIDPHWWHNAANMRTAVRHLGRHFEEMLPDQQTAIRANTRTLMQEMDELDEWVRSRVALVPANQRILVTGHAAFNYFCAAYGFQPKPILGLTAQREPTPQELATLIQTIRDTGIRAVFPEAHLNPQTLETVAQETGVSIGTVLLADNFGANRLTYAEMMRHNVNAIVNALMPPSPDS